MTGLSLVELLVAMALGLLLLAGLISVLVNTSRTHDELRTTSRMIENGRYALQELGNEIRHAGFYGQFYRVTTPTSLPSPCDTGLTELRAGLGLPLQGYAGAAVSPLSCLPGTGGTTRYVPYTDILVIRRAATVATPFDPVDQLVPKVLYLQANPTESVLACSGTTTANASTFTVMHRDRVAGQIKTARAPVRRYLVRIYYIRPCSDCSGNGDGIPTLTRLELRSPLVSEIQCPVLNTDAPTPIAEGIENLQLRYGLDTTEDGAPDDWVPRSGVGNPATAVDWANVMAVEVSLLVRGVDAVAGYSDLKTYVLGDLTVAPLGDRYKRHVFTSVFRAVNPSSRREQ